MEAENYGKIGSKAYYYRFVIKFSRAMIWAMLAALVVGGYYMYFQDNFFVFFGLFFGLLALQGLWIGLLIMLESQTQGYVVSDHAIQIRTGIFSVHKITIPFARITNGTFHQSLTQRLYGVGDVIINQEDKEFVWKDIDSDTAHTLIKAISSRSNIQPISN